MASGAGLLACIAGLAASATLNVALAVVFGVVAFGSIQLIRRVGLPSWATGILIASMIAAAAMIVVWRYEFLAHALAIPAIRNRDVLRGDFSRAATIVGYGLVGNWRGNLCAAFFYLPRARQLSHEGPIDCLGIRDRARLAGNPLHRRGRNWACRNSLSRGSRPRPRFFFSSRSCGLRHRHPRSGLLRYKPAEFLHRGHLRRLDRAGVGTKRQPPGEAIAFRVHGSECQMRATRRCGCRAKPNSSDFWASGSGPTGTAPSPTAESPVSDCRARDRRRRCAPPGSGDALPRR